ncbi:TetR/AcrR family transcriptional regulator [Leucobacter sp. CSA1]|uniref:TetR/AcrR family transcriptional regulator n=1 Tax=Leucobacter chromiisoli TaxID=2796471 RepID=A0A934Q694_9MICO|nr:TetR/AcrR family transcriptional regulator [Leucobacter chromiisoli]MBK0417459.1 TetR/AcrR family transcriptional regulator [Leucobacter chromiisoli]
MTDTRPPEARPSPRRQETRARLLDAAAEVFVEEGLQGASVEAVCTRAGFTRGAFYSNFSSKEELFLAALAREYEQRTDELEQRVTELTPLLRDREGCLERAEVAEYVAEFFAPTDPETVWFVLETEFLLLAMRDPSLAPGFADFLTRSKNGLASMVEGVVGAAGRRFTIPVERAVPILGGVFERALRISALSGRDAPEGIDELGDRIAELIFAITEEA